MPRLRQLGYSQAVLSQLSRSRLASSNATYESRWRLFAAYCASRSRDPFFASPALVADFLLHVAESRRASYSTLAGYRSAIGHVLRLVTDFDPSTCPILSQLMRSFRRSQPVTARRIPQWDFTLVLAVLCRKECRDALLPLPILTAKTVFLLALSSGERRHALAALAFPPSFAEDSVLLPFNEDYIPKSYFLRRNLSRIGPLSIPMCPNPDLLQVCPVRTLRFYLDAVASRRASTQTSLIIPHDLNSVLNISVQSVGRYIVRLVRFCYAVDGQLRPQCHGHDVRKIAASLRALTSVSLDDVLEAGQWSSPSTFLQYYRVPFAPRRRTSLDRWCGLSVAKTVFSLQAKE